jgi:hypothetical protein
LNWRRSTALRSRQTLTTSADIFQDAMDLHQPIKSACCDGGHWVGEDGQGCAVEGINS